MQIQTLGHYEGHTEVEGLLLGGPYRQHLYLQLGDLKLAGNPNPDLNPKS